MAAVFFLVGSMMAPSHWPINRRRFWVTKILFITREIPEPSGSSLAPLLNAPFHQKSVSPVSSFPVLLKSRWDEESMNEN